MRQRKCLVGNGRKEGRGALIQHEREGRPWKALFVMGGGDEAVKIGWKEGLEEEEANFHAHLKGLMKMHTWLRKYVCVCTCAQVNLMQCYPNACVT